AVGGAALASLVVLLFLGSLRTAAIVALAVPLSVLAAFLGLYYLGHTLNIMTLGGLALVLGRVLDDSIVDVENTVRHLGLGRSPPACSWGSRRPSTGSTSGLPPLTSGRCAAACAGAGPCWASWPCWRRRPPCSSPRSARSCSRTWTPATLPSTCASPAGPASRRRSGRWRASSNSSAKRSRRRTST